MEAYNTIASAARVGVGGGAALSMGGEKGGANDGRGRWTDGSTGVASGYRRRAEQVEKGRGWGLTVVPKSMSEFCSEWFQGKGPLPAGLLVFVFAGFCRVWVGFMNN